MATHLVMGDPHCTPKASNDRFLWAGRLAADYKVTHVICMGDFCSMDSLSSYDRAKKSFEKLKKVDHKIIKKVLEDYNKKLRDNKFLIIKILFPRLMPINTRPTGLFFVPPLGPATPVIDTLILLFDNFDKFSTIDLQHS